MFFSCRTLRSLPLLLALAVGCGSSNGDGEEASGTPGAQETAGARGTATVTRPAPDHAWVVFGADTVVAEIARTPEERARGLMHRTDLPEGRGMLFVFEGQGIRSFWMQDTYIPLDIAFLDTDLRVVDIQQMEPETTDAHESAAPAMFALEVPAGWFESRGVRVGDQAHVVF